MFNLLDRVDRPRSLLRDAISLLRPGGQLLITVVLPFRPFVENGRNREAPSEGLDLPYDANFETSASLLWSRLFEGEGLRLRSFSRLPYLSAGDQFCRCYCLEDAVFVLDRGPMADVEQQQQGAQS